MKKIWINFKRQSFKRKIIIMARRKKVEDTVKDYSLEEYKHEIASDNINDNMLIYSGAAIMRMIPDARDGLIPVQRRVLHTMKKDAKLTDSSKHMKVAKVAGLVLGYHPHGDQSVSDALMRMSQEWNYCLPLTDVAGNKGTALTSNNWAASRYVECRLTPYSELMLKNMNKNAVDMVPNYDNTAMEPTVLPTEIPLLFTNGTSGNSKIAVGFSTDIPPHNPIELLTAAEEQNRKPNITLEKLLEIVKGPDLPTGNTLLGLEELEKIYSKGYGKFVIRAQATIEDKDIIIDEIPYGTMRKPLIDAMIKAISSNNIETQVKSIEDETIGNDDGTENTRIVVSCEKNSDPDNILKFLYKKTDLQKNYNCRMLAIVDGKPQFLSLKDYLEIFLDFRRETTRRVYNFDLQKNKDRLHIVDGFLKMIDIAEDVIKTIKESNGKQDSAAQISKLYGFTPVQAEAIVSMQLYRISNQDLQALQKEKTQLEKEIERLDKILNDDKAFKREISKLLKKTIKDLGDIPRKSKIDKETDTDVEVKTTNLINEQDVMVVVTHNGIQRMTQQVYDNNKDKVDSSTIVSVFDAKTTDGVMMLTKNGLAMQRIIHEVENQSIRNDPEDLHRQAATFKADDEIIYSVPFNMSNIKDLDLTIVSVTAKGQVKRSPLNASLLAFTQKGYLTRTKPYNGLKVKGDEVIWVKVVPEEEANNMKLRLTRNGKGRATIVDVKELSTQGASGSGTRALTVKDGVQLQVEEK